MNFLGHLYAADGLTEPLQVGNFIADSVKGDPYRRLPGPVAQGVKLHRAIDQFTDNHPAVENVVALLYPHLGRVAPVVADVLFDHILSRDFDRWHSMGIEQFAQSKYALLTRYRLYFPEPVSRYFPHMIEHDWLSNYGNVEGFSRAIQGISSRLSFRPDLAKAVDHYTNHAVKIDRLFAQFLPELKNYAALTAASYDAPNEDR